MTTFLVLSERVGMITLLDLSNRVGMIIGRDSRITAC